MRSRSVNPGAGASGFAGTVLDGGVLLSFSSSASNSPGVVLVQSHAIVIVKTGIRFGLNVSIFLPNACGLATEFP
jgi:hypothetical protein